nr:hypothetical protein [uncultured Vibrio sp.]
MREIKICAMVRLCFFCIISSKASVDGAKEIASTILIKVGAVGLLEATKSRSVRGLE